MGKLESEALGLLAADYWQQRLEDEPLMATALGDRRYDGRLPDISPEGRAAIRKRYGEVVRRCEAIAEDALAPPEHSAYVNQSCSYNHGFTVGVISNVARWCVFVRGSF